MKGGEAKKNKAELVEGIKRFWLTVDATEIYPTFEKSDSSNHGTEWQCNWLLIYSIVVLLYSQ